MWMSSDDISFQKHFKIVIITFHSDIWFTTLTIKICTGNFLEQIKGVQNCYLKSYIQHVSARGVQLVISPSLLTLTVFSMCPPVTHEHVRTHLTITSYVMMTNFFTAQNETTYKMKYTWLKAQHVHLVCKHHCVGNLIQQWKSEKVNTLCM